MNPDKQTTLISKNIHAKLKEYCDKNGYKIYTVIDKAVSKEIGLE